MIDVKLPQLGDTVEEAQLTSWLKKVGDVVEKDEPLLEVTTDKVTVEVPSEHHGILKEILLHEGSKVVQADIICRMEEV